MTGVTPVTNGSCHTRHAPRGRDMGREAWGPPYYVGGPWRHACHAGLKSENGLIQTEPSTPATNRPCHAPGVSERDRVLSHARAWIDAALPEQILRLALGNRPFGPAAVGGSGGIRLAWPWAAVSTSGRGRTRPNPFPTVLSPASAILALLPRRASMPPTRDTARQHSRMFITLTPKKNKLDRRMDAGSR